MSITAHRVRRFGVAVRGVGDADAALAWRGSLHEALDTSLRPALDGALDAAAARARLGERTWHLPRLQVRMRARTPQALADALRAALDGALADAMPVDAAAAPALQSAAERAAAAFAAYLATGRVPWHDDEAEPALLASALRREAIDALDRVLGAAVWPRGLDPAAGSAAAALPMLQRWAALLDAPAFERLRAALAPRVEAEAGMPVADDATATNEAAPLLWRVWQRHAQAPSGASGAVAAPPPAAPARGTDARSAPGAAPGDETRRVVADADPPRATSSPTKDAAPAVAPWLARDAGLVLLSPFLPTLLRATGCLADDDDKTLRPDRVTTAAALLHALVTGRDEAFEFELTLAKLLLGVAPDAALPPGPLAIDAAARAQADACLHAVIGHWSALGHTSIDGLRQTFLAREGLLSRRDNGWHLRVADEPFDLLLGRLPWGFGLVRMPWMDAPLHVRWGGWGA